MYIFIGYSILEYTKSTPCPKSTKSGRVVRFKALVELNTFSEFSDTVMAVLGDFNYKDRHVFVRSMDHSTLLSTSFIISTGL